MENIRTTVCSNFNRLVDSSGKTKREIAQQMQVSEATLQRWKSGVSFPELPNLEKLAKILGVDEREFYSSHEPVVKHEPVSKTLQKILNVPDDVYDLAAKLGDPKNNAWETVRAALDLAIEAKQAKNQQA